MNDGDKLIYIVSKLQRRIKIYGSDVDFSQANDGIVGYMVVFEDRNKALAWANNDESLIVTGIERANA